MRITDSQSMTKAYFKYVKRQKNDADAVNSQRDGIKKNENEMKMMKRKSKEKREKEKEKHLTRMTKKEKMKEQKNIKTKNQTK